MKNVLTFDESAKKDILAIFDKEEDSEGFIVEKGNPSQRVLTTDGEEVSVKEFAGLTNGSEVFIKSDLISLLRAAKRRT